MELWSIQERRVITDLGFGAFSLAFSKDGTLLAVGKNNGTVDIWEVYSRKKVVVLKGQASDISVDAVAFSSDNRFLAAGGLMRGTVNLWKLGLNQEIATLKGHATTIHSIAFTPDGRVLIVQGDVVDIWKAETDEQISNKRTLKRVLDDTVRLRIR